MPVLPIIDVRGGAEDEGVLVVAVLQDVEFWRAYPTMAEAEGAKKLLETELETAKTDADVGFVLVDWATGVGPGDRFGEAE